MNRSIKAIIVDDEMLARESLVETLTSFPEIKIIGECCNGFEAIGMIREEKPDLVFLDIQMPKLDGFDVIELSPFYPFPYLLDFHSDQFLF